MNDSASNSPHGARPSGSAKEIQPAADNWTGASPHFEESQENLLDYRTPNGWAIAGLVAGIFSFLAMFGPLGWIVPAAAIVASSAALFRLGSRESVTFGRGAALVGLSLGLIFLTAGPTAQWSAEWSLQEEAKQVAIEWFEYLQHNEPHKAAQLGVSPELRQPLDDSLWAYYREHPEAKRELEDFVRQPLTRALLTLGPTAQVRYYETQNIERGAKHDQLEQFYAVTYDDAGKKKSFFVRLTMNRSIDPATDRGRWRVSNAGGGVRPKSWNG